MMTEFEWRAMTIEQREIHYNRQRKCPHVYIPPEDERLRESYSFDPYMHTSHMEFCTKQFDCSCPMCVYQIGIERGRESRKVDPNAVREKWKKLLS